MKATQQHQLKSGGLIIELSQNGNLSHVFLDDKNSPFNDYKGKLQIVDQLENRILSDDSSLCKALTSQEGSALKFAKAFHHSPINLMEGWAEEKDHIRWGLCLRLSEGKERSITVQQFFPMPKNPDQWELWTARADMPISLSRCAAYEIEYGDMNCGTMVPAICIYNRSTNAGITIAAPFDQRLPQLRFGIDHKAEGIRLQNGLLGLRAGREINISFMIRSHEGCWRPGFGWLVQKYKPYFYPPNPESNKLKGGIQWGNAYFSDHEINQMAKLGLKWWEIHDHFPYYGQYAPEGVDEWDNVATLEQPGKRAAAKSSKEIIRKHMKQLHKFGVKGFIYFQISGDGYIPYVEKSYPESIAKGPHGKPFPTWIKCCLMNSDPSLPFGKDIARQTKKLLEYYPDVDGVFLDQLCYNAIDIAHNDGITMYNNKPAYSLVFCYDKNVKALCDEAHSRGKLVYSNGPYDVYVQKDIDGHMAEGSLWGCGQFQYLTIGKPLIFLWGLKSLEMAEEMFRHCLLYGANYSCRWASEIPRAAYKVYETYAPLVDMLHGREWIFDPDPLEAPYGYKGNIYKGIDGSYLIPIIAWEPLFQKRYSKEKLSLKVKAADIDRVSKAVLFGAGARSLGQLEMKREDHALRVCFDKSIKFGVIRLQMK